MDARSQAYVRLAEDGSVDERMYQTDPVYHALVYRVRHGSTVKGEDVDVTRIRRAHVIAWDGDLEVCEACTQEWYRKGHEEGCDTVHIIAAYDRLLERARQAWCCEWDLEHGGYRTTSECIGRTRDADVVERQWRAVAMDLRDSLLDHMPHRFEDRPCSCGGTYLRANGGDHSDVCDRTNDVLRALKAVTG